MNNRHAYLIMAHSRFDMLQRLIETLDDTRNDIYIHVDKRCGGFVPTRLHAQFSNLIITERISVYWADFSQVEAMMILLKEAVSKGAYRYYHFLSGVDLPIKTQNEIHDFFDSSDCEFIGIVPKQSYYSVRRLKYYHPLTKNSFYRHSKLLKISDRVLEYAQRCMGVNRLVGSELKEQKIYDGWGLWSITESLVQYVLEKETLIRNAFNYSIAADELFLQTLAYNNERFRAKLYNPMDLRKGSQRFIDWERGRPYVWGSSGNWKDDFRLLVESPYMFARKFDDKVAPELVRNIIAHVTQK